MIGVVEKIKQEAFLSSTGYGGTKLVRLSAVLRILEDYEDSNVALFKRLERIAELKDEKLQELADLVNSHPKLEDNIWSSVEKPYLTIVEEWKEKVLEKFAELGLDTKEDQTEAPHRGSVKQAPKRKNRQK